jgi:nuclear transport factor 2 (NTF2) superfamily protein
MPGTFTFVPSTTAGQVVPLDEIPEDVKTNVTEAWAALKGNEGRIRATFANKDEADVWYRFAASYAAQFPEGALKMRRSPTKDKPSDATIDFTLKRDVEANGERRAESPTGTAKK